MQYQEKLNVVVIASGRGSNFQALIDAQEKKETPFRIVRLVTDNRDAKAIEKAKKAGIEHHIVERKRFGSRAEYDYALADAVKPEETGLVCLAGYMRILGKSFLDRFDGNVINIHPALLPSFPGLDAQQQALDYGVKISGCTVHFVDEGVDTGKVIIQSAVPVLADDSADSLSLRILEQEHRIYPEAVRLIATGAVQVPGARTKP